MEKARFLFCTISLFVFFGCQTITPPDANPVTIGAESLQVIEAKHPVTISLSEQIFDFGKIKPEKEYHHTFVITNTGRNDLIVESVKGCCDNVCFNQVRDPVKPGDSCEIEVIFLPGPHNLGAFKKGTTVTANTETKTFVLEIAGEVVN
jgi:hypothetical protein